MSTDTDLLLDAGRPDARHLLFTLLAAAIGLVGGMSAGMIVMSDLLPALA